MESERLKRALDAGPDCPSIQRLAYYADGLLPVAELQAHETHISACAHCLTELELLRAFTTMAVDRDEEVADAVAWLRRRETEIFGPNPNDQHSWKKWFSLGRLQPALTLAAVLVAMAAGYYLKNPSAPRLPADVGTGTETTRSMRVHLNDPRGDVTAVPERLTWETVSGASGYHVRLMETDRQEIWSSDVVNPAADLPTDVRARIRPAKTLQWQVTAFGADHRPIAESDSQRFRLLK
jgi:hypothetical protein